MFILFRFRTFWDLPKMMKSGTSNISINRTSNRVRSSIKKSLKMELKYHCCEFADDLQKFQNLQALCRDRLKDLGVTLTRTRSKSLQSLLVFSRSLNKKSSRYSSRNSRGTFWYGKYWEIYVFLWLHFFANCTFLQNLEHFRAFHFSDIRGLCLMKWPSEMLS